MSADRVGVDSGQILIVDPANIPAALLEELLDGGWAVIVDTPTGDGAYPVIIDDLGDIAILTGRR